MQQPILSCLCVTYNRPEFHEFLLWNFNKQTCRDIELIVVDGSTRSYADRFRQDRVRYIHLHDQPNIPLKRNLAMDNATAPYIAWFDDDDWQHPRRGEILLAQLKTGALLTGCNSSFFYNVLDGSIKTYSGSQILFNSLGVERKIAGATRFREDCLKASDNEWCRQIFSKTRHQTVTLKSEPLFFWLSHRKNISNPSANVRGTGRGTADSRVAALIKDEQESFTRLLQQIATGDHAAEPDPGAPKPEPEKPAVSEPEVFKADISVVAAVRNRSGYRVENFLKTLRHQTHLSGEVEIVLVDSASAPDHFASLWHLAKAYRATLIRLEAEHPWNKSLALNVGIRAATRAQVFLTDIDMIFQPNFIAAALHALEQHQGKVVLHCQSRDLPAHAVKDATDVIAGFGALLAQSRWHTRLGNGACFITTREWLHKVRGMDEAYGQWGAMDRDISMRAQWDGLPVVWLENTAFLHQWHVGKQALWRHDPAIRNAWDANHRRYSNYLKAAERRQPLEDQIVRNPESWGEIAASVFLEQGAVRKPLAQIKPPKAVAAAPAAKTVANTAPPPMTKQPGTAGNNSPAAAFPGKVVLAFNACPADADTLELILPHVVRQCGYPFARKLLFSDRSALTGAYAGKRRFDVDKYEMALNRLQENQMIDTVHECEDLQETVRPLLAGNFETKSYVGSPTLSYLASMLLPEADYILRMDSDILFYRATGFDWISEGIRRMEADEKILFFMATPGPFTENLRRMRSFRRDVRQADGTLHYSSVTTRYFLFKKSRLETYCRQHLAPGKQRLEIALGELCAANHLKRVCLHSPNAWHLHTNASQWASQSPAALDKLIDCVERNDIHASQIGEYDLTPQWRSELVLSN